MFFLDICGSLHLSPGTVIYEITNKWAPLLQGRIGALLRGEKGIWQAAVKPVDQSPSPTAVAHHHSKDRGGGDKGRQILEEDSLRHSWLAHCAHLPHSRDPQLDEALQSAGETPCAVSVTAAKRIVAATHESQQTQRRRGRTSEGTCWSHRQRIDGRRWFYVCTLQKKSILRNCKISQLETVLGMSLRGRTRVARVASVARPA